MDDLVSIIVPIYNTEKYLKKCIDSIINQTYRNLEIICINDGSIDSSGKICDEYAKSDNRIQVIHKENEGVSSARNIGIKIAKGKYICFIDADDFIDEKYIQTLLENLLETKSDISVCNYKEFKNLDNLKNSNTVNTKMCFSAEETINNLNLKNICTLALWSKLYRRELFKDIEFPDIALSEDILITYQLILKSKKVVLDSRIMYFYRRSSTSLTSNINSLNLERMTEGEKIVKYIAQEMPSQYHSTVYAYIINIAGLYNNMINKNLYDKKAEDEIIKRLQKYCKEIRKMEKLPFKRRIQIFLICHFSRFYRLAYKIFKLIRGSEWKI